MKSLPIHTNKMLRIQERSAAPKSLSIKSRRQSVAPFVDKRSEAVQLTGLQDMANSSRQVVGQLQARVGDRELCGFTSVKSAEAVSAFPVQRVQINQRGNQSWWGDYNTNAPAPFEAWITRLKNEGNAALLRTIRDTIAGGAEHYDAVARSVVRRALDYLAPAPAALPAEMIDADHRLGHLPKDQWWKLFIDLPLQDVGRSADENALRFDREKSPGFYAAMMAAMENQVANVNPANPMPKTFAGYRALHGQVVAGVKRSVGGAAERRFENVPDECAGMGVTYPMTMPGVEQIPTPDALRELSEEGVLGLDQGYLDRANALPGGIGTLAASDDSDQKALGLLGQNTERVAATGGGFMSRVEPINVTDARPPHNEQYRVATDRAPAAVPGMVDGLFAVYQHDIGVAVGEARRPDQERGKLQAIVKVVRALHVGHFFTDANGRLNAMILLNKLLAEQGFSPAIVDAPAYFGGSKDIDELEGIVVEGMARFSAAVDAFHSPAVVPDAAAVPAPSAAAPQIPASDPQSSGLVHASSVAVVDTRTKEVVA